MRHALLILCSALTIFAAEPDPWTKVKDLKSGTEIRIVRKDAKAPVLAKFDEADADRLLCVVKNEQISIPKAEIDRLDARPTAGSRVKPNYTSKTEDPKFDKPPAGPPGMARPSTSSSSGLTIGGKPDFETIYRRSPGK